MATAFLNYSFRDKDAAQAIARRLERNGIYADPERHVPPGANYEASVRRAIETADCIVVLWSASLTRSQYAALEMEKVIKAWSEDRLVLVALDETPLPVGLRDQATIDFVGREDDALEEIVAAVRNQLRARGALDAPPPPSAAAPRAAGRSARNGLAVLTGVFIGVVLVGAALIGLNETLRFRLTEGATPDGAAQETQLWSSGSPALIWLLAGALMLIGAFVLFRFVARRRASRRDIRAPEATSSKPVPPADAQREVFVSYSWKDSSIVEQLVTRIEGAGYGVWIDRSSRDSASSRYAGPIVRAIRSSRVVAVMCSNNAFGSDHVVREVYVAGDFKKPFLRIDLDGADVPDELLYFLTGFPKVGPVELESGDVKDIMQRCVA